MIIKVKEFVFGTHAVSKEEGERLCETIVELLETEESVILDFVDVRITTATFFNHAIAQLLRTYTPEILNERLKITHLSSSQQETLKYVIDNAKIYYGVVDTDDSKYIEANKKSQDLSILDKALNDLFEL